ncbi:hypothetical protein B0T24DRAFT_350101 [Lasiosphaeria ovina]|uniref:Uncharacterized protein n=1 Tax=Lasiosphaeria ovina TaxID=92902 RepID=A0AAE0K2Q8_9PEZI|nr:hypothetical protein B0T24DRAFT_350101 [Lasiosphaeria ovina]
MPKLSLATHMAMFQQPAAAISTLLGESRSSRLIKSGLCRQLSSALPFPLAELRSTPWLSDVDLEPPQQQQSLGQKSKGYHAAPRLLITSEFKMQRKY